MASGRWQVAPRTAYRDRVGRYFQCRVVSRGFHMYVHAVVLSFDVICCAALRCVELLPALLPLPSLDLGPAPSPTFPTVPLSVDSKSDATIRQNPDRLPSRAGCIHGDIVKYLPYGSSRDLGNVPRYHSVDLEKWWGPQPS